MIKLSYLCYTLNAFLRLFQTHAPFTTQLSDVREPLTDQVNHQTFCFSINLGCKFFVKEPTTEVLGKDYCNHPYYGLN